MTTIDITIPANPWVMGVLVFASVVTVIRIVRWVLDILP